MEHQADSREASQHLQICKRGQGVEFRFSKKDLLLVVEVVLKTTTSGFKKK